jgi:AraC-like DNA-binding protein
LNDYTFGINEFASEMANSKSTLRKKLKSLTGLSSVEFIREIRLKYAIIMLTSKSESISEIAYSVGFNDTKYFSRCFKNEFGLGPKAYREKYERIESEDCIKQSLPKEVNF